MREKEGWKHKCFFFSNASGIFKFMYSFHPNKECSLLILSSNLVKTVTYSPNSLIIGDLTPEVVILLDTYFEVFLWVGSKSREADKKIALETAVDYSKKAVTIDGRFLEIYCKANLSRPSSTKVTVVNEGNETVDFLAVFHGWSRQVQKV